MGYSRKKTNREGWGYWISKQVENPGVKNKNKVGSPGVI